MSVSQFTDTGTQAAVFSHVNSGYSPTTAGPTQNAFSYAVTSGNCFLKQYSLLSGQTQPVDFCSGGLTDLVGDLVNSTKLFNVQFLGVSGGVQAEFYQSGAMRIPGLCTASGFPASGFGMLLAPGDTVKWGGGGSGVVPALSAGQQNVVFRAVSGAATFQVGFYGV